MNNLELIHPDDLQQRMQAQSEKIFDTIIRLRSRVAKAPPGRLRTTIRGNKPRYYHITDPKKANGQYIPRGEDWNSSTTSSTNTARKRPTTRTRICPIAAGSS